MIGSALRAWRGGHDKARTPALNAIDRMGARHDQHDPGGIFQVVESGGRAGHGDLDVIMGGKPQYLLDLRAYEPAGFVPTCWWQQTSPQSHFTRSPTCSLLTETGPVTLSGARLIRIIDVRLLDPLEILLDGDDAVESVRRTVRTRAETWATRMLDGDDRTAAHTIIRVISTLYPGDTPFDPPAAWWRTPLGQVVVGRVGHPTARAVSYSLAGAMLGITRQGVHDLVTRGKLDRHPEGGVTPESVRARLNRRSPTS
jgi:hypothetical protein